MAFFFALIGILLGLGLAVVLIAILPDFLAIAVMLACGVWGLVSMLE